MRLVYLSPVPWSSFAQRPQKFARWFHATTGGEVLWLDPYPSRFPALADFKKIGVSDQTESGDLEPWLTVLKPKALPIEPLPGSGLINGSFCWGELLKTVQSFANQGNTMLVIGKPTVLALKVLDLLKDHSSVYDAMDDFPTFYSGLSKNAMARRELEIARRTTHLLASSTKLRKKWESHRSHVKFVPNGLDVALLPAAKNSAAKRSPAVFGYVGTVGAWFDWKWLISLAESRPDDQIHVIGPVFNPTDLKLAPNITFFPPCSHKDALERMLSFDVALIPFLHNELTSSVDPIKYYEYRALGLPILSTSFGEMAYRGDQEGVYLCDSPSDFNAAVASALEYTHSAALSEQFKQENSWEARFASTALI
ncbi:glycosyl transferase [Pseudomonas sp. COW5]|uniref:glycosyl transferase n=1 Tax=Pseudomonas sp. COW5 TaxID=2981253 RepID=UPI002246BEA7|nr:glycosyl transferase [Pseudomonas sp. COW5]MCX2545081.1 glycosyl transferase [Pseudomonas sp. COW5]